jgi:hypothetical protein
MQEKEAEFKIKLQAKDSELEILKRREVKAAFKTACKLTGINCKCGAKIKGCAKFKKQHVCSFCLEQKQRFYTC